MERANGSQTERAVAPFTSPSFVVLCRRKALCLQLLGIAAAATKLLTSGTQPQPGGSSLDQKAAAVVSTMTVVSLFHAVESGLGVAGVGTALDRQLAQAAAALGPSYAKMVSWACI